MNNELIEAQTEMVETLAEEQPKRPAKVTFSDEQQQVVDRIIREVQGRTSREMREELTTTKRELDALRVASPTADAGAQELAMQVSILKAERDSLTRDKHEATITSQITAACGNVFVDTPLAAQILRSQVKLGEDGTIRILNADGSERLTNTLDRASLRDAVEDLAHSKPFLARGTVAPGVGSTESRGSNPVSQDTLLKTLFGRGADVRKANALALRDIHQYRQLKVQAKSRGII